jgi:hypothetical protein
MNKTGNLDKQRNYSIYAIDFDGTIVTNAWPGIGSLVIAMRDAILELERRGDKWILNTMREGEKLQEALDFLAEKGLYPDAVNDNLPELCEAFQNNPRKIYADYYVDDHSMRISDFLKAHDTLADTVAKCQTCFAVEYENEIYSIDYYYEKEDGTAMVSLSDANGTYEVSCLDIHDDCSTFYDLREVRN